MNFHVTTGKKYIADEKQLLQDHTEDVTENRELFFCHDWVSHR